MRATHKRVVRICFAKKYLRIIYKIFTFAKRLRVKYKKIIVMNNNDIRWKQRFENYVKALEKLNGAAMILKSGHTYGAGIEDLLKEGLIQRFEYTHELSWNVMKDYAEYQGNTEIRGSRDAIRWALQNGLINNKVWMKSIEDRNLSSHDYDSETAEEIINKIVGTYIPLFNTFKNVMEKIGAEDE